jgi:hypothetical protein
MLYVLTFGGDPITLEALPPAEAARAAEELDRWWRHNRRWGRILTGARLTAPVTATTIRFVGSRALLQDGPFTPEPEAIGGYAIVRVADLDEAVALAYSWPAGGYVEIRPLLATPDGASEVLDYARETADRGQGR